MTPSSLLLLGSTDLTLSVAKRAVDAGITLAGVVSPPAEFSISYSAEPVRNSRYVDLSGWCRQQQVMFRPYRTVEDISAAAADTGAAAALLAGWYHMVPAHVRRVFPRGCVGLHASLLPRYRGGAPLTWALLNGDTEAGVSLFELSSGVDDGLLYDQRRLPIAPDDYIGDLLCKAEAIALDMLSDTMPAILDGGLQGRPQQGEASYSLQRQPSDGVIDWRCTASGIARLVRGVSRPYPGARTSLDGTQLTIWRARAAEGAPSVHGTPGQVVRLPELPFPAVVTGSGLLLVEEVEGADGFDGAALARCHQQRLGSA